MAYLSLTALIEETIKRLRSVQGAGTQLYSESIIASQIQDVYTVVRDERWWDELTAWTQKTLDGTTGRVTVPFTGLQGFKDIASVYVNTNSQPMPRLHTDVNPYRLSGTHPRYLEPLSLAQDPTGTFGFRVWPLASTGTITVRHRADPANVFTDPAVVVPFDDVALINGAAAKYAAGDGANPAFVADFENTFNTRMEQLSRMLASAPIDLDPRMSFPNGVTRWEEYD
jgi:hypothetical protein